MENPEKIIERSKTAALYRAEIQAAAALHAECVEGGHFGTAERHFKRMQQFMTYLEKLEKEPQ